MAEDTFPENICRLYSADWIWFLLKKDWNREKHTDTVIVVMTAVTAAVLNRILLRMDLGSFPISFPFLLVGNGILLIIWPGFGFVK